MTRKSAIQTQTQSKSSFPSLHTGLLQRKYDSCRQHMIAGGECTGCAKKKVGLQRKLTIGSSSDPLELEADRVAEQVMAAPENSAISHSSPRIQRFTGQASEQSDMSAPASVDHVLASPGRPLDPTLQQDMGQRFGHDFSRVRVHTGGEAARSARDVSADAYTARHNIVFGLGQFAPETQRGRRLIAHELTHVIQQSNVNRIHPHQSDGAPANSISISARSPQFLARQETSGKDLEKFSTEKDTEVRQQNTPPQPTPNAGPQLPACNMQAVDEWISDPKTPSVKLPGLTILSGRTALPEFNLAPSPAGGKGFLILPTSASIPTIQSNFVKPGVRHLDKTMLNFRPDSNSRFYQGPGTSYLNVLEMTQDGSDQIRAGEQEHCDDFRLAFYFSLYRFAEIINDMAAQSIIYPSQAAARSALHKNIKMDPANFLNYFICLADRLRQIRDEVPNRWHTLKLAPVDSITLDPAISKERVAIRKITRNQVPEVGKHPSGELWLTDAMPACARYANFQPNKSSSPSTNHP
jgi:hypothetical protein